MSTDQKKLLGSRLKAARIAANHSQDFSAEVLGVTRQSVSAWETGVSSPSALQLGRLAVIYCTCAHTLLFGASFSPIQLRDLLGADVETQPHENFSDWRKR